MSAPDRLNLLFTSTAYPPSIGGAQIHHHMLARQLGTRHRVRVVTQWDETRADWLLGTTLRAPNQTREYRIDGVDVRRLGLTRAEKVLLVPFVAAYYPLMNVSLPLIAAVLERHVQPSATDAHIVHNVRIGREGLSWASRNVARRRGVPFVFTPVHHPRWSGWRYRAYERLYREADAVLALTEVEKKVLTRLGVREELISVTGVGPVLAESWDAESFRRRHGIDGPMVLFLGQHYRYKGWGQLLDAAPLVWRQVPEAQFVFLGPPVGGSEDRFRSLLDRRIHRLGAVDLETKTSALAACSLLCVPSTQESLGGVYLEAWSFARPVVACPIPAVAELIADGVDGTLVPQEAPALAEAIAHLLLHPTVATEMGAAGKRKVEERYSWPALAQRTEEAYRRAIQGG